MRARRVVVLAALVSLVVVSCGDNDNGGSPDPCDPSRHAAAFDACRQASGMDACVAAGGLWARGGLFADFHCFCSTGQDGCPCSTLSQCLGGCVAPGGPSDQCNVTEGRCEAEVPSFGCVCTLGSDGAFHGLCAD